MMFWYGGHWTFWEAMLMWIGIVAFWGLVFWALYAAIQGWPNSRGTREPPGQARQLLDMRLARGEISTDEYRQLRDLIDGTAQSNPADKVRGREPGDDGRARPAA